MRKGERARERKEREKERKRDDRSRVGVGTARLGERGALAPLTRQRFSRAVSFSQPAISRRPVCTTEYLFLHPRVPSSLDYHPSPLSYPLTYTFFHLSVFSLLSEIPVFVTLFISFARVITASARLHFGLQRKPPLFSPLHLVSFFSHPLRSPLHFVLARSAGNRGAEAREPANVDEDQGL